MYAYVKEISANQTHSAFDLQEILRQDEESLKPLLNTVIPQDFIEIYSLDD